MADTTWLILGASSPVANAFARNVAASGAKVILAGRDEKELSAQAGDLTLRSTRGGQASVLRFDALDTDSHAVFAQEVKNQTEGKLSVFLAFAMMDDQAVMDAGRVDLALRTMAATYNGAVSVLHHLMSQFEAQAGGAIVALGSVAGDRGRLKNFVYGSAKAGLHTYLQGLRVKLFPSGVTVLTVKPGFVDTSMTWGMDGVFLVASPDSVADTCLKAVEKGRHVIYAPWFWRYIMLIIQHIPEFIFKRLKI